MSDWQVGDLAVCVDAEPLPTQGDKHHIALRQLKVGRGYRVLGLAPKIGVIVEGVTAADQQFGFGWLERRFRKIRPDEREACEPEFVTLLKRSKRGVSA